MTLYAACCYFLIYSFAGWVTEVAYHAVTLGKIMNRGFLNGPVCPVYGFGMTAVLFVFDNIGTDNPFIVFVIGLVLTTLIELIAGWILYTFFHARWWDYSSMPLNIRGYICPAFSIIWGFAVLTVVKIAHPALAAVTVDLIPVKILLPIMIIFMTVMLIDTSVTAATLIGLNKKLSELDTISKAMRDYSDKLTEKIGQHTINTAQSAQSARVQAALARAEIRDAADLKLDDLQLRYEDIRSSIVRHRHYGAGRLINVFPNVYHRYYKDILEDIKTILHSR